MKWLMNSYKKTEVSNETNDTDSLVPVCKGSVTLLITLIIVLGNDFV
jgi:hypothetical protein